MHDAVASAADVDLPTIGRLVDAFGPTAAAFALVAAVLFYFYRRDHIKKHGDLTLLNERLITVLDRTAENSSRLAESVNRVAEANRVTAEASKAAAEAVTRQVDILVRAFERREKR